MNLSDQKRDFIDIYEQRISWSSQAERKMFENDVESLIFAARKEQLAVNLENFIIKSTKDINEAKQKINELR